MNLSTVFIFSENPDVLAGFYTKLLQKDPDWREEGYSGFLVGNTMLMIGPHDKVKGINSQPERIFVNFDVEDVQKESERIKNLGADVVKEPYKPAEAQDMWIATFADPDGNYFQIVTPWKNNK